MVGPKVRRQLFSGGGVAWLTSQCFGADLDLTGHERGTMASRGAVPRYQQAKNTNANDNVVSLADYRASKQLAKAA